MPLVPFKRTLVAPMHLLIEKVVFIQALQELFRTYYCPYSFNPYLVMLLPASTKASLSHRVLIHLGFWLIYISFFTLLRSENAYGIFTSFVAELMRLPIKILAVYLTAYVLLPHFLITKKYKTLGLLLSVLLAGAAILLHAVTYYGIHPLQLGELYILRGPFWNGYAIFKALLDIFFIIVLVAAIRIVQYWYENEKATKALEKEKLEAELNFLKAQIHPHFLFNTLNNLYSLTLQKSDDAPQVVLRLSGLVNYMLYHTRDAQVPLSKEIESLHNYVALERIRHGNSLDIAFDVSGEINQARIAPMLLLPFIENSFKHGVSEELENKWISIDLNVENSKLDFRLENSKSPNSGFTHSHLSMQTGGIGLNNVQRRLELLYPHHHELKVCDEGDSYFVRLTIDLNQETHIPTLLSRSI